METYELIEETIATTIDYATEIKEETFEHIKSGYDYTRYAASIIYDTVLKKYVHLKTISNLDFIIIKKVILKRMSTTSLKEKEVKIFNIDVTNTLKKYIGYVSINSEEINYFRKRINDIIIESDFKKKDKEKKSEEIECTENYYMYISYLFHNKKYIMCIENPQKEKIKIDRYPYVLNNEFEYEFISKGYNYSGTNLLKLFEGPYKDFNSDLSNVSPRIILNVPQCIYQHNIYDINVTNLLAKYYDTRTSTPINIIISLDSSITEEIEHQIGLESGVEI